MRYRFGRFTEVSFGQATLLSAAALGLGLSLPAVAQQGDDRARSQMVEEVLVTARRQVENLQEVPISMAVFDQEQLSNSNVVNASDLAAMTPGLTVNTRFGDDSSAFAIRGFTQELRTTASVGVYFADVVAPRGGGAVTAGDGAGPGAYFDLQNVQVLKGPQGTLFGRNTTGGAIMLTPQEPTTELEGYIEASAGNYDMWRLQGVINVPVGDNVRARIGIDRQQRDGYLKNVSGVGHDRLSDADYLSVRASLVVDLTPNLENYTVASWTDSKNNGSVSQVFACNTSGGGLLVAVYGPLCATQLAGQSGDFYEVANAIPGSKSLIEQWQIINTTTWDVTDDLTIKNILSYADLETTLTTGVFGSNFFVPTFTGGAVTGRMPFYFANSGQIPGLPTTSQTSLVEELQFQGSAFGDRMIWQAGLYFETNKPDGDGAGLSFGNIGCDLGSFGGDPSGYRCNDWFTAQLGLPITLGSVAVSTGTVEFESRALYAQSTYDLSDRFSVTGGIRYTWDESYGNSRQWIYQFPGSTETGAGYFAPRATSPICGDPSASLPGCQVLLQQKSEAPTWLLGLDYKPGHDLMLYGKYARGYRQGSVNIVGINGLNTHEPEEVDTFEIGLKKRFDGPMPGVFNLSAFYNDFRDQQIQLGILPVTGVPTTAIVNAGKSSIWGAEIEAGIEPFDGFTLNLSYTYLNTEVKEIEVPQVAPGLLFAPPSLTSAEGEPLSYSPEHQASLTAAWRLPLSPALGDIVLAATYTYTAEQQATSSGVTPYATIPSYELLNLNLNWSGIAGTPLDASLFATNVLEEEYYAFVSGQYDSLGFESRGVGQPRMVGARLRYNF